MTRKQVNRFALALIACVLLPALQSSADAARKRQCRRVLVHAAESNKKRPRKKPKFSAANVLDLEFHVWLNRRWLDGNHELELKVYTPNGNLYQTLSQPFTIGDEVSSGTRRGRYQVMTTTLPVAGTTIVSSSLYGVWKVEAFLDGASRRCSARKFVIKP